MTDPWIRPPVRSGPYSPPRSPINRVHYFGEAAGDEWYPICQLKARQYTLLPGGSLEPDAVDKCTHCLQALSPGG